MDWQKLDHEWARTPAAGAARELILMRVLGSIVEHYTHPVALGREVFDGLEPPVIFAANHSSHLDTPTILMAFPKRWRAKTATIAAADYFYKNRVVASLVALSFATVPIERHGGMSRGTGERLSRLLTEGWNLLVYPEGTRSRTGEMGPLRSGAGFLAVEHSLPLIPIYVRGTHASMPVGRPWPRKHPVTICFGSAIYPAPGNDHKDVTARLTAALADMSSRSGGSRPP